ncbi:hypothetical protein B1964_00770 [Gordonia sp. i37]|nr:hypothetical protein B1964_00770 [Gordonia sp. i37]
MLLNDAADRKRQPVAWFVRIVLVIPVGVVAVGRQQRCGASPPRTDLHPTDRVDVHLVDGQRGESAA